jgi:putative transposase
VAQRRYPTDLTDAEWAVLEPLFAPYATGRPRVRPTREILDAIFYVLRAGCAWRLLPREFPPWPTVYYHFRGWRDDGTWDDASQALRRAERVRQGRDPEPSAAIVDSQTVKTTERGGRAATTPARRPAGASGTSRSTRSACC